jgi:hypothetical protein
VVARSSIWSGPGWPRSTDQPIMRPARARARECQGVSGVFSGGAQRLDFVSGSVRECHGVDVKTVVRPRRLRLATGKFSQEFTRRVTECQEASPGVTPCQDVSRVADGPRFDLLLSSRTGDTVRRMVATITHYVLEVAAEAGPGRIRLGSHSSWHGTRNTVPSIAVEEGSAVRRRGYASKNEGQR